MNISIIIPNYNGEKLLKKNLPLVVEAVKGYKRGKVEIIIPDDPSTDSSRAFIKDFIVNIKEKNITGLTINNDDKGKAGFSKNVNRGVGVATGEILILLNSDVYPHKNFLEPLLKNFEDREVFAVGCLDESIENGKKILRGRGVGSFTRGFLVHRAGNFDRVSTLWVSGGSGAFRKNIWDKIGGFDSLYDPFYWEDIDLSYRALKSGYKIAFEKKSIVIHEHEKGIVKELFGDDYVKNISYRNQFLFIWKNVTDPALLLSHFLWLPYHFIIAFIGGDWVFLSGFFRAGIKLGNVLNSRNQVKKMFIKSDSDVIEGNLK